jgi:hypothetical protein
MPLLPGHIDLRQAADAGECARCPLMAVAESCILLISNNRPCPRPPQSPTFQTANRHKLSRELVVETLGSLNCEEDLGVFVAGRDKNAFKSEVCIALQIAVGEPNVLGIVVRDA